MRTLRDGGKLFLVGPRRYGKTLILKTAGDPIGTTSPIISVESLNLPGHSKKMVASSGQTRMSVE
jgi:predicted AAA+ superfamily ATPase